MKILCFSYLRYFFKYQSPYLEVFEKNNTYPYYDVGCYYCFMKRSTFVWVFPRCINVQIKRPCLIDSRLYDKLYKIKECAELSIISSPKHCHV